MQKAKELLTEDSVLRMVGSERPCWEPGLLYQRPTPAWRLVPPPLVELIQQASTSVWHHGMHARQDVAIVADSDVSYYGDSEPRRSGGS